MRSVDFHYDNAYAPFRLAREKPDGVRPLGGIGGVEDRLRLVAFAELQARDLFLYGASIFSGMAPSEWISSWKAFAVVEDRHAQLLLSRMNDLGIDPGARSVSNKLSRLCRGTKDPVLFLFLLSSAEERGMEAGFILGEQMHKADPTSAALFAQIAKEEVEHVETARQFLAPYASAPLQEQAKALSAVV